MVKICVCGHFGGNENFLDGQTIKTKNIYSALVKELGKENVKKCDTYRWTKNPITFFIKCINELRKNEIMIILPAQNGVKVFIPLFTFFNKFYHKKIFYVVIGGWLPEVLENKRKLTMQIKKIDKIFVETKIMQSKLQEQGVSNVKVMPNFKNINIVGILRKKVNLPLKLCTFSRVTKEKGIEDAIDVVNKINKKYDKYICKLDIYGRVEREYEEQFYKFAERFPEYIEYKGTIDYNKTTGTVQMYDLLLFPTYYAGEGFAGTLLDAMAAGVPAIASDWKYNSEIIKNGFNGYLYEVHNNLQLQNIIENLANNTDIIIKMKSNCIKEAKKYIPETVIKILLNEI